MRQISDMDMDMDIDIDIDHGRLNSSWGRFMSGCSASTYLSVCLSAWLTGLL